MIMLRQMFSTGLFHAISYEEHAGGGGDVQLYIIITGFVVLDVRHVRQCLSEIRAGIFPYVVFPSLVCLGSVAAFIYFLHENLRSYWTMSA